MQRLLIRNIKTLVSCDEQDTVYENVDLYAEDGVIRAIGPALKRQADEILDAGHMLCYPGLVNTIICTSSFPAICRRCRIWNCSIG